MYVKIASARVSTVYNNGAASANSSYNAGFAYDTTGKLQVDTASVPATKSYNNGIARHSDGVVCINTHDPSLVSYAYLPGVNGNYFSTPNAVANQVTGDLEIVAKIASANYATTNQTIIGKDNTVVVSAAYFFQLSRAGQTAGTLTLIVWQSTVAKLAHSSAALATTDGNTVWVKVTLAVSTGKVNFYQSQDGVTYTLLGVEQTITAAATDAGTSAVSVGSVAAGTSNFFVGNIFSVQVYSGINGTLAVDFNADDWIETSTNGVTQASSTTGEVWTLNNTGTNLAGIWGVARGHGGIFTDNMGALYVNVTDAVSGAVGGIPITAKGAVAVSAVT